MSEKRRGYLYTRVAALPQMGDLLIQMQVSQQREYAQKNNIEIVDTIIEDEGIIRDLGPKFREMMELAPKQGIDLIIVFSIHRIARNLKGVQELIGMLNQTGIGFESVSEDLPSDNPATLAEHLYQYGFLAYLSNLERARLMKQMVRRSTENNS